MNKYKKNIKGNYMVCDFCLEIQNHPGHSFEKIYKNKIKSRIVADYDDFVVMPTLGQLTFKSVLVLPKLHIEKMSSLPDKKIEKLNNIINILIRNNYKDEKTILFEHGATCQSGGGCGIYHAHIHLVPTTKNVTINEMLPINTNQEIYSSQSNFFETLKNLKYQSEYLILSDTFNQVRYVKTNSVKQYQSQFFRRQLVNTLKINREWDWRKYNRPENDLIKTIYQFY